MVYGLKGRGRIEPGNFADLLVFDPSKVRDAATYETPARPSRGIRLVIVNGRPVWSNGEETGERPGHFLKRL